MQGNAAPAGNGRSVSGFVRRSAARGGDHYASVAKVPGMTTPQYKFEHNNGMIKPVKLKAIRRDRIPSW